MDLCLNSTQQPQHLGQAPKCPGGWLEAEEEGAAPEDGTGGPPGGKHFFITPTAFLSCFFGDDIFN